MFVALFHYITVKLRNYFEPLPMQTFLVRYREYRLDSWVAMEHLIKLETYFHIWKYVSKPKYQDLPIFFDDIWFKRSLVGIHLLNKLQWRLKYSSEQILPLPYKCSTLLSLFLCLKNELCSEIVNLPINLCCLVPGTV